ncbi:MAG: aminotransferase class IV [Bdellovibrionaceae bacterium]|nr:aminotransferase class IV [Pseudobdellovibrionaceae bacterium]
MPSVISPEQWLLEVKSKAPQVRKSFRAMYSSWVGGIVTDPALMLVPVDDHQFHRGDGVFEAIKFINSRIWLLQPHLQRLLRSASALSLQMPFSVQELESIILETCRVSGLSDGLIRVFLSRGPGSFSVNPYDTLGPQLYVVVTELPPVPESKFRNGVRAGRSSIPVKEPWLAQTKTCNYLPNVMMKKEAVDRGLDFVVGEFNEKFTEGPTENLILLNENNELIKPCPDRILAGTTMSRIFELAGACREIRGLKTRDFGLREILLAKEVMVVGTTIDVLPVVEFEGHRIGDGTPGPVSKELLELIRRDQQQGAKFV